MRALEVGWSLRRTSGGLEEGADSGRLRVPIGLIDRPTERRQDHLIVDFSGEAGHLGIFGSVRTGKSTTLQTIIVSAALTHVPGEVAFHCIDLGGGQLDALLQLPHVGTVCDMSNPTLVRRVIGEVVAAIEERERVFAARAISSAHGMRDLWRGGHLPEFDYADLFLVIDNFPRLASEFEDVVDAINHIASRGLTYGVHLVLTAARASDLKSKLSEAVAGRLELRLGDPADSAIDRRAAAEIPPDKPGRCLTYDKLLAQVALPRVDGRPDRTELQDVLRSLAESAAGSWGRSGVPAVRLLPAVVHYSDLPGPDLDLSPGIPLGLAEGDLQPLYLDLLEADSHLLIFGDRGSGKTTALRLVAQGYMDRCTDEQIVFAVIDTRRSLHDFVPEAYLGAYADSPTSAGALAAGVAKELETRVTHLSGPLHNQTVSPPPHIFLLIDDLELLTDTPGRPLEPIQSYLPYARELRLHVVAARQAGGAGRAIFGPFLQTLREGGAAGLAMSGARSEGALWPDVFLTPQPPGRGVLVRVRDNLAKTIQVASLD